jgi:pilus assembly protein CpaF
MAESMSAAIDFIVFLARLADGSRRVTQVAEITGMEVDTISLSDLYVLDLRKSPDGLSAVLRPTGAVPRLYDRLRKQGEEPPMDFFRKGTDP